MTKKKPKYDPDMCASCMWCEPEKMDLKPCTSCGRPTCHECRTKHEAKCGYCASYNFPKRFKILLQDNDMGYYHADVHVHVMIFSGIGIHYHVDVKQNDRKARKGRHPWSEFSKTTKPNRIKEHILDAIKKHHPRKKVVTVYFKQNRVRRWFYREGD